MRIFGFFACAILLFSLMLSGCVVRTYKQTRDRVDQDLSSGNRGYLMGQPSSSMETSDRKSTRTTQVVEIELYSPIKFEGKTKTKAAKGEISDIPEEIMVSETIVEDEIRTEQYTVQKGDTLQKISQKFYGTTRKWKKIFEMNKGRLKGENKIYPGQVLDIPVESISGISEEIVGKVK